ncbi:MAG: hypothetical protein ACXAD7_12495 [Candidatus Kariarchaeaceae archaeon]|jgi:hypothetical protein
MTTSDSEVESLSDFFDIEETDKPRVKVKPGLIFEGEYQKKKMDRIWERIVRQNKQIEGKCKEL